MTQTAPPLTITVPEAGRRWGISRGLAYELARTGQLPGVIKLGGRYVVSLKQFEKALNGSQETAA